GMRTPARARYAGYRFPAEIIGHAVWLYFRFPLGLRMVEELLAARGIVVSYETVRQWARKFGQPFANQIRRRLPRVGDKWYLDENLGRAPPFTSSPEVGRESLVSAYPRVTFRSWERRNRRVISLPPRLRPSAHSVMRRGKAVETGALMAWSSAGH